MKVRYEEVGLVTVSGRTIAGVIIAATCVGGIGYGVYELSWAVKSNSTDRNAQINRQSLGFQQARVDEITNKLQDLSKLKTAEAGLQAGQEDQLAADKAQEQAVKDIICRDWQQITPTYRDGLDAQLAANVTAMCNPSNLSNG